MKHYKIILNQSVPIGTGLPGFLVEVIGPLVKKEEDKKQPSQRLLQGLISSCFFKVVTNRKVYKI